MAVDAARGVVDGVGLASVSGVGGAEFESLESAEVSEESTGLAESVSEAHPAVINSATHTIDRLALLPMWKSNVHGDLNFFYLCVV